MKETVSLGRIIFTRLAGLGVFLQLVIGAVTPIGCLFYRKQNKHLENRSFLFPVPYSFALGCFHEYSCVAWFLFLFLFLLANLNEIRITLDCNVTFPNYLGGMYENKSIRTCLHLTY